MITLSDILPLLIAASPSFENDWNAYTHFWMEDGDTFWSAGEDSLESERELRGFYEMDAFAKHLIGCLHEGDTVAFPVVFAMIEHLLIEGSSEVREFVTIGLFEDLQGLPDGESVASDEFLQWLGPVSRAGWFGAIAHRQGRGDVLDIVQDAIGRSGHAHEDRSDVS